MPIKRNLKTLPITSLHQCNRNTNKRKPSCLFKSLKDLFKKCKKSMKSIYKCCKEIWALILSVLWVCYNIILLPEYLLYFLVYSIFIITDFIYKLGFKTYGKIVRIFELRKTNAQTTNRTLTSEQNELTIVLDIDETLVYTTEEPPSILDYDYFCVDDCENGIYYVYKRPHLDYFLTKVAQLGRIIIFTASEESYASQVIKNIGQTVIISGAYYRDVSSLIKVVVYIATVWVCEETEKYRG